MSEKAQKTWTLAIAGIGALSTLVMIGRFTGTVETKLESVMAKVSEKGVHDHEQDAAINSLQRDTAVIQSKLQGISINVGKIPGRVVQQIADKEE